MFYLIKRKRWSTSNPSDYYCSFCVCVCAQCARDNEQKTNSFQKKKKEKKNYTIHNNRKMEIFSIPMMMFITTNRNWPNSIEVDKFFELNKTYVCGFFSFSWLDWVVYLALVGACVFSLFQFHISSIYIRIHCFHLILIFMRVCECVCACEVRLLPLLVFNILKEFFTLTFK